REERCRHPDDLPRRRGEAVRAELARSDPDAVPMGVERVAEALGAVLPTGAILVDEGVRSSRTLLRHLPVGDRQLVMRSSGGALGWGTPAAVGAKVGRPERPVVAVVGDGSFQFSVQAIWSSVEAGAPIVVVVLDNGGYLAVKRAIEGYVGLAHDRRHHPGTEIAGVDHLAVAKGYGADGVAVTKSSDLGPAVESGLAGERPFVVHVRVAQVRP
ncbi:MAG: thiamine pyrophosphate-dependent enzyme, partial [Acidimicrobiales bacterium]